MKNLIGIGCVLLLSAGMAFSQLATNWVDCSTTLLAGKTQSGGCCSFGVSGVRCNRLNGDIYMNVIENGIWKSADNGQTWTRVDQNKVGGRNETGWGMDQDQNQPTRMANFSLDGIDGYTTDGTTWKQFGNVNRNWDFGSVDWSSSSALTIIAAEHENGGKIHASTNGGTSWTLLSVTTNVSGWPDAMVGAMNATTLIYSKGTNGINRSTNNGSSWTQVSTMNPASRTPTYFNGKHYLGTSAGLIVSTDDGATWARQGGSVSIYQGPFFGADENTMVIAGTTGIYKSINAGTTWTKQADLCPKEKTGYNLSDVNYWGTYAWDPIHNSVFATAITHHAYRLDLGGTSISNQPVSKRAAAGFSVVNSTVRSGVRFDRIEVFSLSGRMLYAQRLAPAYSTRIPLSAGLTGEPRIIRISTEKGFIENLCK